MRKPPENMLEALPGTIRVSEDSLKGIQQAFENHESCGFRYGGIQGTGNAYLTGISQNDWMLMQTFPSKVTNNMIDNANAAGIHLEVCLIFAFSIYILSLIILNWKQRKLLMSQKAGNVPYCRWGDKFIYPICCCGFGK